MAGVPLTILGDVGVETGSVRHDGDVRISGAVAPGRVVEASGSILLLGDLRAGQLVAGGDITVKGIASGPDALIDALGTVRVRQATDTKILSGGDLLIDSAAERCEMAAGGRVRLCRAPGVIRGGRTQASVWVEVNRLEGSCGRPAEVTVGRMPFDDGREQVAMRIEFTRKQAAAATDREAATPVEYRKRITTRRAYRHLSVALERRLAQIEKAEAANGVPCVTVRGDFPADAIVTLGSAKDVLRFTPGRPSGSFVAALENGEVRIRPLKESIGVG